MTGGESVTRGRRDELGWKGRRVLAGLISMTLLLSVIVATGRAGERARPEKPETRAGEIANRIASAYASIQQKDGSFPDYVVSRTGPDGRNAYGPAMLGGPLFMNGVRTARSRVASAGLRSIQFGVRSGFGFTRLSGRSAGPTSTFEYPFSMLPLLEARRSWEGRSGRRFRPAPSILQMVRSEIRRARPIPSRTDPKRFIDGRNRVTLERLVWLEVIRTGLGPIRGEAGRGTILSTPGAFQADSNRWMRGLVFSPPDFPAGPSAGPASSVSDPPDWPLAYHALTSALMAKYAPMAPTGVRPAVWSKLREAVRHSRLVASPAGDLAYEGRSALQPWTLSLTAFAALAAAASPGTSDAESIENKAFAGLLIDRLESEYLAPGGRVLLSPAIREDPTLGVLGLDRYAAEISYAGLTLLGLEWASPLDPGPPAPYRPGSDLLLAAEPAKTRGFIRTPGLWAAVSGGRNKDGDLGGDAGPTGALQRVDGEWVWLVPPRPSLRMPASESPSSWLSLPRGDGGVASPNVISTSREGDRITQRVSFEVEGPLADEELEVVFAPAECGGLSFEFSSVPEPVEVSLWIPGTPLGGNGTSFSSGEVEVLASRAVEASTGPVAYGSTHPLLTVLMVTVPADDPLTLDLCLAD